MMSQERSQCLSQSSIAGVKRALEFETPNESESSKSKKISKKNDCVCTCCHKKRLQRNKCLIFKMSRYDFSKTEVRTALCQRYSEATCKELVCKECDLKLLSLSLTVSSGASAQQGVGDSTNSGQKYDKHNSANDSSKLFVCTCCQLERADR